MRSALALLLSVTAAASAAAQDVDPTAPGARLAALQRAAVDSRDVERQRLFAYGFRGLDGVYSTHRTHSNRPVPVVACGPFGDLRPWTGARSAYRDAGRLAAIYGNTPPRTVDDRHGYADQTDLHRAMSHAAEQGARRIIVLLLDGCDWQTWAAASVVRSGRWDPAGYEHELSVFTAELPVLRSVGAVVTSPLRGAGVPPGFDLQRGGRFPWSPQDAVYLAGDLRARSPVEPPPARSELHAVVDSAASATAIFSGVKTINGRVGVDGRGEPATPLGRALQARGWAVATVTDVPFGHATPAAVYASAGSRGDYRAIGRQLLGLGPWQGVDVALGYGQGYGDHSHLAAADLAAVREAAEWRVVTPAKGDDARAQLATAADAVAAARSAHHRSDSRLFGYFGTELFDHAPYRTADGAYDPTPDLDYGSGRVRQPEVYDAAIRAALPDLQSMTRAATTVLEAVPERPFLLVVEAGLIDWSHHANNLDHAVGEVFSAAECFTLLADWVGGHGWWDETLLLVTSDHGHLLQVDLPALRDHLHR